MQGRVNEAVRRRLGGGQRAREEVTESIWQAVALPPCARKQPRKEVALVLAKADCSSRCTSPIAATLVEMRSVTRTTGCVRLPAQAGHMARLL